MKRIGSFLCIAFAMALSCGYAAASPEPHHFTYAETGGHVFIGGYESATAKVVRELALIQWQHDVASESRTTRSDMHASSGGLVFTAIQAQPDVDGSQPV
jgi:hypothetical protein